VAPAALPVECPLPPPTPGCSARAAPSAAHRVSSDTIDDKLTWRIFALFTNGPDSFKRNIMKHKWQGGKAGWPKAEYWGEGSLFVHEEHSDDWDAPGRLKMALKTGTACLDISS
jgi:hypothetical protein